MARIRSLVAGVIGALVAVSLSGQTIQTDGQVQALGFSGDGSNLSNVNAELLDGLDSLAFASSADTYSKAEVDTLVAEGARKRFYLTDSTVAANLATTSCANGFHMASTWELRNLDALTYAWDEPTARTAGDIGMDGTPVRGIRGWARTGYDASFDPEPGRANCNLWIDTDPSWYGTILGLDGASDVEGPLRFEWTQAFANCASSVRLWCIED